MRIEKVTCPVTGDVVNADRSEAMGTKGKPIVTTYTDPDQEGAPDFAKLNWGILGISVLVVNPEYTEMVKKREETRAQVVAELKKQGEHTQADIEMAVENVFANMDLVVLPTETVIKTHTLYDLSPKALTVITKAVETATGLKSWT